MTGAAAELNDSDSTAIAGQDDAGVMHAMVSPTSDKVGGQRRGSRPVRG